MNDTQFCEISQFQGREGVLGRAKNLLGKRLLIKQSVSAKSLALLLNVYSRTFFATN